MIPLRPTFFSRALTNLSRPARRASAPFMAAVALDGRFAAAFDPAVSEKRRDGAVDWYRGYDRAALLGQLTALRAAALTEANP